MGLARPHQTISSLGLNNGVRIELYNPLEFHVNVYFRGPGAGAAAGSRVGVTAPALLGAGALPSLCAMASLGAGSLAHWERQSLVGNSVKLEAWCHFIYYVVKGGGKMSRAFPNGLADPLGLE